MPGATLVVAPAWRRNDVGNVEEWVKRNPPTQKEIQQVLDYGARWATARFYADENFPAAAVQLLGKWAQEFKPIRKLV
jgi:hypothetical protein